MIIECPECGKKNVTDKPPQHDKVYHCGKCGAVITFLRPDDIEVREDARTQIKAGYTQKAELESEVSIVENTSGQGKLTVVPQEIKGWNWGAFILNWIWSIGNNVWIGLLSLIPYAGIIMIIVLGVKGNEWAWQHKRWDSVEHFKITQKKWRDWGIWLLIIGILIWLAILMADL